jgi:nitrogen regulatory protein PII 2
MKEIMAIIRMNRMNETKLALEKAGAGSVTATGRVLGRGKGLVDFKILKAAEEGDETAVSLLGDGPRLIPKRMLIIAVPDSGLKAAVEAIISANRSGRPGDGKIFVLPCLDAYRVRTGESGEKVLQ